ncbi:MAG: hypothetical protein H7Y09_00270, partial [Chitinophagaceae bacterium]|nr:hypothetical protein [Anaerolineae bacterium]
MNIPQTGRREIPQTDKEIREMLRKGIAADKTDPFATDPNTPISKLGKLALRRDDVNDLFALGDLCALQSLTQLAENEIRLLIFYVGKTLIAYRKAVRQS